MASRSFKPASYLASAAQHKPSRSPRPSFNRSGSASSTASSRSEEGFVATLSSLSTSDTVEGEGEYIGPPRGHPIGSTSSPVLRPRPEATPSKKRSKPISIEVPKRNLPTSYTPLTGRGDNFKGGYFPDYDDIQHKYRPHPLAHASGFPGPAPSIPQPSPGASTPMSPSNMSACSSQPSPTNSEATPKPSGLTFSPVNFGPPPNLDGFAIPKGKYYPSNYISPDVSRSSTPRADCPAPPTTLQIPTFNSLGKKKSTSTHERNSSDVKRKIQKYQRDMFAQARHAPPNDSVRNAVPGPTTARLLPIGSPGPINTPLELDESDGYIVAGSRARGDGLTSYGLERQQSLVDSMISMERSRLHNSNPTTD